MLLLWPWHTTKPDMNISTAKEIESSNMTTGKRSPTSRVIDPKSKMDKTNIESVVLARFERQESDEQLLLAMKEEWEKPIEYYGKVIDENSNSVADASIKLTWSGMKDNVKTNTVTIKSDIDGFFSLHEKTGWCLNVLVKKEGYYASKNGYKCFIYSNRIDKHVPDALNPVIFVLRKQGTPEPLVALNRNYVIPRDGTPTSIDLVSGKKSTEDNGNFVVQCWTHDAGKKSGEKYDWECLITIPGGGLVSTEEEFAFLAPEQGYVPTIKISMPASSPFWSGHGKLKFYYRLTDGRYGIMKFEMAAGGGHFCILNSCLNPTGSRNLEPMDETKEKRVFPPGYTEVVPDFGSE